MDDDALTIRVTSGDRPRDGESPAVALVFGALGVMAPFVGLVFAVLALRKTGRLMAEIPTYLHPARRDYVAAARLLGWVGAALQCLLIVGYVAWLTILAAAVGDAHRLEQDLIAEVGRAQRAMEAEAERSRAAMEDALRRGPVQAWSAPAVAARPSTPKKPDGPGLTQRLMTDLARGQLSRLRITGYAIVPGRRDVYIEGVAVPEGGELPRRLIPAQASVRVTSVSRERVSFRILARGAGAEPLDVVREIGIPGARR